MKLQGKVVINDGVLYADGIYFLSAELLQVNDSGIQSALSELYDVLSFN